MKTAFLFPGQGAQQVGMGKDLYEAFPAAADAIDRAEAGSQLPLKKLCFEAGEEELSRTDIAQPSIFTVSAATLAAMAELLGERMPRADYLAGLSLGEYTALYAAGAMELETAVRLVTRRGELMQQAATATPSGMVSIIGLDEPAAQKLVEAAAQGQTLACANFNCPGQIVLSGETDACKRAELLAKDFGASGAVPLKVAGAFHSRIMAPAASRLAEAMEQSSFDNPQTTVVANVDAQPYESANQIAPKLLAQLTGSVRWQQSMEWLLAQGVERFYEIGPGRVLAGLMRRINRKAEVISVNSADAVRKLA